MPDIVRRGVTIRHSAQVAASSAPQQRAMLFAYELWNPSLVEPIRFVNDKADLIATLEDDAPRNASESVTFIACPLALQRPEESDTAASPSVSLGRPDVSGILKRAMDAARGSLDSWILIERLYASDDLSGPAMLPPLTFELATVSTAGPAAQVGAQYDDDANTAIPAISFTRAEYPGLKR